MAVDFRRTVVRAQDLLVAELRFHNLELDQSAPRLLPSGSGEPLVILTLPPQHVAEQVFPIAPNHEPRLPAALGEQPMVESRIAGWSRIAFRIPATVPFVPLELDPLLELLRTCELRVVDAALPRSFDPSPPGWLLSILLSIFGFALPSGPALRAPDTDETSLELPFRLILSPPAAAGFEHRSLPVVGDAGRVELWHSQLGIAPGTLGELDAADRTVRGIWMRTADPDIGFQSDPAPLPASLTDPFRTTLTPQDRHQIVHLSANFRARGAGLYPRAIPVRRLAVTSLGTTVDLRGEWPTRPAGMDLEEWAHRAAIGRDYFVRVVHAGWLFPFGHRASLVTISERRFEKTQEYDTAPLRSRAFVVVREPDRDFHPGAAPTPQLDRTMPLWRVGVRTLITPDIAESTDNAFEIRLAFGGGAVQFHLDGTDSARNLVELHMPLWFVRASALDADVVAAVNGFGEHLVAVAAQGASPGDAGVPFDILPLDKAQKAGGDSTWNVRAITWRGDATGAHDGTPPFYPRAASLDLRLPPAETVVGHTLTPSRVTYHERFVQHGLDPLQNPGTVVAEFVNRVEMGFAGKGDLAGGLVRPDLSISGLSHLLGPVAGIKLGDIASGAFQPSDFFAGGPKLPKLFGSLDLDKLLEATDLFDGPLALPRAPKLPPLPDRVKLHWEPKLRDYPTTDPTFVTKPNSKLTLDVTARSPSASEIDCRLEHFALRLVQPSLACIELDFELAEFKVRGAKPDIDIRLGDLKFIGALSFVETLRKIIPLDGFSDPPAIHVTPTGADASFSMSVPSLTLGMFSLENISLGAGFLVPFDERALSVRFNFCERHEPFLLTVSALGGGGFVLIELDARGLQRLEAALEFGASLSMDFGVASGSVHAMAGIYFAYSSADGVTLTGYLRVGGNVTALGLVSVSIELYLALTYKDPGKAKGTATLTVEVDVFLFSASVEITCERTFAGSAADPSFDDLMSPYRHGELGVGTPLAGPRVAAGESPWAQYWAAYA